MRVRSGGGVSRRCSSTARADREEQLLEALVGDRAHLVHGKTARLEVGPHHVGEVPAVRHIDLVERDESRPVLEPAVRRQFALDRVDVGHRVALGLQRGGVDDVHQHRRALDVAQELQAEALAGGGARDQPGHIGHRERHVAGADDAEVGHERGERVVGDLGPGRGDDRDQRRLAGRREADQPNVGDALQLEDDVELVARFAELGEARRLALACWPARRCPGHRGRRGPPRTRCPRRRGRPGSRRTWSARRCRPGPAAPGSRRWRRRGRCPCPSCRWAP